MDIETALVRNRLRWLGHVGRMDNDRPVKELLFGELEDGTRQVGRPLLRYKDTLKDILKRANVLHNWKNYINNRPEWRQFTHNVTMKIDQLRKETNHQKSEKRQQKKAK